MTDSVATDPFTNRQNLATRAYANPTNFQARVALYQHQTPRHEPAAVAASLLRTVTGPVLDVGCGPGRYLAALVRDQPERPVIGVDISPGMVAVATSAARCAGAVADATALPFGDGTCGAVLALHMLYHVPDPAAALAEFVRVVRPGGTVLLATNAEGDKAEMRALVAAAAGAINVSIPDYGNAMRFHLDDAEAMARRQFASVERVDLESIVEVDTPEPVVAFIASSSAWYSGTESVLDEVRRRVVAAIETAGAFQIRTHMGFLVCR
jgi:SAM-dependent methyltransferase